MDARSFVARANDTAALDQNGTNLRSAARRFIHLLDRKLHHSLLNLWPHTNAPPLRPHEDSQCVYRVGLNESLGAPKECLGTDVRPATAEARPPGPARAPALAGPTSSAGLAWPAGGFLGEEQGMSSCIVDPAVS